MPTPYRMSKKLQLIGRIFCCLGLILQIFTFARAQDLKALIRIEATPVRTGFVSGENTVGQRNLSFLLSGYGFDKLGERISDLKLFDSDGKSISYKMFVAGEYVAETHFYRWSYKIDLQPFHLRPTATSLPFELRTATANLSWLSDTNGILMLDDLLPKFVVIGRKTTANIRVESPLNWRTVSSELQPKPNEYEVSDVEKSVIYVGKNLVENELEVGVSKISIVTDGNWRFSNSDPVEFTNEIYENYAKVFRFDDSRRSIIAIMKMPVTSRAGTWEAETRGRNVTIISEDMLFEAQSKQRLHEQLRHEIFHLWLPNGVNLSGNYDWFYEGFGLYQSLKFGVDVNRLRFDDMLATLSRAISTDGLVSNGTSLIDASKNRFGSSNTTVYARGMVVAFLCDLALLDRSKGKRSVGNILRDIYKQHHNSAIRVNGNEAVLAEFAKYPELKEIVDRYIKSGETIDSAMYVRLAGLDVQDQNGIKRLAVLPKPNSRQKDLLDKLGYNSWRTLSKNN